jgi:hypothetical protein
LEPYATWNSAFGGSAAYGTTVYLTAGTGYHYYVTRVGTTTYWQAAFCVAGSTCVTYSGSQNLGKSSFAQAAAGGETGTSTSVSFGSAYYNPNEYTSNNGGPYGWGCYDATDGFSAPTPYVPGHLSYCGTNSNFTITY